MTLRVAMPAGWPSHEEAKPASLDTWEASRFCIQGYRMRGPRRIAVLFLGVGIVSVGFIAARVYDHNSAVKPLERKDERAIKRHQSILERAKKGDVDLLFLGDSITQGWEGPSGKDVWEKHFAPQKAANFGVGGDQTGHVLWRITEGKELEGIQPKLIVLMIGTNNMGGNSAEEIADGITAHRQGIEQVEFPL